MRKAASSRHSFAMVSAQASIPSPVGGWNARDPEAAMKNTDAIHLRNWFATTSGVEVRPGHTSHATGLPSSVESLMAYVSAGASKMFAASATAFYDVTSAGAAGSGVVTGLTNARWQHINFTTSGGSFLYCVNGSDKPQLYNGTTWTAVDGSSSPSITGITTTDIVHINAFKRRIWFVQKSTLKAWYLPVDSVGGAAAALDFSSIASRGGYLMAMGTWTIDAGEGVDDYAVFATSEGEVIVYKGTDPTSSSTWFLVGVYRMARPLGRRCFVKYNGDLLYSSVDGVYPLSSALQSAQASPVSAITDKIRKAMTEAGAVYGGNFGWQMIVYRPKNMLLLNVPVAEGSGQEQYVMNTITSAWARFTGLSANCWETLGDDIYFGGNQAVYQGLTGTNDNGSNIEAYAKPAFSYFGVHGVKKRFVQARPVMLSNGTPGVQVGFNTDYRDTEIFTTPSFSASSFGAWDSGLWDGAVWGDELNPQLGWQAISGVGFCGSLVVKVASQGITVKWMATDYVYETGGII